VEVEAVGGYGVRKREKKRKERARGRGKRRRRRLLRAIDDEELDKSACRSSGIKRVSLF
jgi:hypothetical protein